MECNSCNVLYINSVKCHEADCPEQWKDEIRECLFCGNDFKPEYPEQKCCDISCTDAYYN